MYYYYCFCLFRASAGLGDTSPSFLLENGGHSLVVDEDGRKIVLAHTDQLLLDEEHDVLRHSWVLVMHDKSRKRVVVCRRGSEHLCLGTTADGGSRIELVPRSSSIAFRVIQVIE